MNRYQAGSCILICTIVGGIAFIVGGAVGYGDGMREGIEIGVKLHADGKRVVTTLPDGTRVVTPPAPPTGATP